MFKLNQNATVRA